MGNRCNSRTEAGASDRVALVSSYERSDAGNLHTYRAILWGKEYGYDKEMLSYKYQAWILYLHSCHIHIFSFPGNHTVIFVNEAATIEIGSAYLRIVGFSQLFATLETLTSGAYTGQGLTKYPATVSIVFTTMRIPLALLLGKSLGMGIEGVWWSISLTSVIKGIVLYLLYRKREKELEKSNIQYSSI